ncbi:MAG: hypothetical protein ACFFC7_34675, partial [Candidatus Hermodarchaeota archaeon]
MIIDGIAIMDRSGLILISRLNLDFDNRPLVNVPFLHPFPTTSSIAADSPDVSYIRLMEKFIYYSTSGSMIVVLVSPKELNVQKLVILIDKIKDRFKEIHSMFLKFGKRSYFQVFNEILDETLKELGKWEPQFRWIPKSLSNQPFFQQLDPTSLTAVAKAACPYCGVQSLVAGKNKDTTTE